MWKTFHLSVFSKNPINYIGIHRSMNANGIYMIFGTSWWKCFKWYHSNNHNHWLCKHKHISISMYRSIAGPNYCDFLPIDKNNSGYSSSLTAGYTKFAIQKLFFIKEWCWLSTTFKRHHTLLRCFQCPKLKDIGYFLTQTYTLWEELVYGTVNVPWITLCNIHYFQ